MLCFSGPPLLSWRGPSSTAGCKGFGDALGSWSEQDTPTRAFTRDWGTLRPSLETPLMAGSKGSGVKVPESNPTPDTEKVTVWILSSQNRRAKVLSAQPLE